MRRPTRSTALLFIVAAIGLALVVVSSPTAARRALFNSAWLAAATVILALPAGTLLALLVARCDVVGRRAAIAAVTVLLFTPLYVQLVGWDAALGKLGWYSLATGSLAEPFLAGMRGAIFVHAMAAIPWVTAIVGIGLTQFDPAEEEAALLVARPAVVLWRITLPQAVPFIVAAALWTVVGTVSEMTVTNIYLVDPQRWTYTERFYMTYASAGLQAATGALLPDLMALGIVVALSLAIVRAITNRRIIAGHSTNALFGIGGRTMASVTLWAVLGTLLGVPILSLIAKAGFFVVSQEGQRLATWSPTVFAEQIAAVPTRFAVEIRGTLVVAIGAASLATILASAVAWRARHNRWCNHGASALIALALAAPGPVVGAALIGAFNHDIPPAIPLGDGTQKSWLLVLYDDTPLAPIVAQAIRALPLAVLLLWHSFATIGDDVLEAAALDGLSPRKRFWRIAVPQRWVSIVGTWIAGVAIAAGDLAWAHLVTPPGLDLLQRRVFGLVHSGVDEQVAAISLVGMMVYGASAFAVICLWSRGRQFASPARR